MSAMMSTFSASPVGSAESREPIRVHDATRYGQHSGDPQEASTSLQALAQRKRKQPAESDGINTTKRLQATPLANGLDVIAPAPNPSSTLDPGHVDQAQIYHGGPEECSELQGAAQSEQRVVRSPLFKLCILS